MSLFKESNRLRSIEKGIFWCLLAASTETSCLHGIEGAAQELVGVSRDVRLEFPYDYEKERKKSVVLLSKKEIKPVKAPGISYI